MLATRASWLLGLALSLAAESSWAEKIVFKQEVVPKQSWFIYALTILALLALALVLAQKAKHGAVKKRACQILDKQRLANKTLVYVLEYHQQRFLVVDNQQALALHALKQEADDE